MKEPHAPDVSPDMRFIPVVTPSQLVVDMILANTAPEGHGHACCAPDYFGPWVAVTDTANWSAQDTAPRWFAICRWFAGWIWHGYFRTRILPGPWSRWMPTTARTFSTGSLRASAIVWLALLIFGNRFSGAGIAHFEDVILAYVSQVFFLPLLIDTSGNAGSQSATLMVRALARGDVEMKD